MRKMMIAVRSEVFAGALADRLSEQYELFICEDGLTASEQFNKFEPQVFVIDLSLPIINGLTVLKNIPKAKFPQIVIGVSAGTSDLINRLAFDLGVTHIMTLPCQPDAFCDLLTDLELQALLPAQRPRHERIEDILSILSFPDTPISLEQTVVAIRLFQQNPKQKLSIELYPEVAKICKTSKEDVEYNIRELIRKAWDARVPAIWSKFIPQAKTCPTTRKFLSWIIKLL